MISRARPLARIAPPDHITIRMHQPHVGSVTLARLPASRDSRPAHRALPAPIQLRKAQQHASSASREHTAIGMEWTIVGSVKLARLPASQDSLAAHRALPEPTQIRKAQQHASSATREHTVLGME